MIADADELQSSPPVQRVCLVPF